MLVGLMLRQICNLGIRKFRLLQCLLNINLRKERCRIAQTSLIAHHVKDILLHLKETGLRKPRALTASKHPLQFLKGVVGNAQILIGAASPEIEQNLLKPRGDNLRKVRKHAGLVNVHVPYGRLTFGGICRIFFARIRAVDAGGDIRTVLGGIFAKSALRFLSEGLHQLAANALRLRTVAAAGRLHRPGCPKIYRILIRRHGRACDSRPCPQILPHTHQRTAQKITAFPLLRISASGILDIDADAPDQVSGRTLRQQCVAGGQQVAQQAGILLEFGANTASQNLHANRLPQRIIIARNHMPQSLDFAQIIRRLNLLGNLRIAERQRLLHHHVLLHRTVAPPRIPEIRSIPVAEIPVLTVRIIEPDYALTHTFSSSEHSAVPPLERTTCPFCYCTARREGLQEKTAPHKRCRAIVFSGTSFNRGQIQWINFIHNIPAPTIR